MMIDTRNLLVRIRKPCQVVPKQNQTSPLIELSRDGAALVVYDGPDAPEAYLGEYSIGFARAFAEHHAFLNVLDFGEIVASSNRVAFALQNGKVQAALYYSRNIIGSVIDLRIMGLVSFGSESGMATPLVAACARLELDEGGQHVEASAHVRVMPDQLINAGSAKVLSRVGFYPRRLSLNPIASRNIHLNLSVEPDGEHFISLEMVAGSRDLQTATQSVLADWSMTEAWNV